MRETHPHRTEEPGQDLFDAVEGGSRPVANIVPVRAAVPAWKKPSQTRLSLGSLSLSEEVLADREEWG
jgi:hypothetical protein